MASEPNAEHVEDFAFQPIGARENGRQRGGFFRYLSPASNSLIAAGAVQNVDQVEAQRALRVIDGGDVDQKVEREFSSQRADEIGYPLGCAVDGMLAQVLLESQKDLGNPCLYLLRKFAVPR